MDHEGQRSRLRSFVIGGLLGASAAIATASRRRRRARRAGPGGLKAFEGAPCYREAVERDERS